MTSELKIHALSNWLISGAPPQDDYNETIAELARRLVDAGVEADIIAVYQRPKNPLVAGKRFLWSREDGLKVRDFTHEHIESSPYFKDGIVERAMVLARTIRYRIGEMPEFDSHPGSKSMIDGGYSEYAAIPLIAVNEVNAVLAVAVKRKGGLPDEQIEICRRIAAPLARVVESRVRYEGIASLLATFLGRDAGARVNAGMVRRGDAEMIRAVILFTDIEGYTEQSNCLPISETVNLLNRYFEALEQPILKNGGEVLKLMGDGLLAIFPTPDDITAEEGAALSALSAVEDARTLLTGSAIRFRAAYHVGEIHYGNIGGLTRLDFTAIGPAVNLTARLLDAASQKGLEAVCSSAFAKLVQNRVEDLGTFEFKGFAKPQQAYAVR
jgi:adenylate cyclase